MILEIFAAENDELDYEWNEFHVYANTDRNRHDKFYSDDSSGCSCDYYEKPDLTADVKWIPRASVIAHFNEWASFMNPMNKTRCLEKLIEALNKYK